MARSSQTFAVMACVLAWSTGALLAIPSPAAASPAWLAAQSITAEGQAASFAGLAMDAQGTAIAVSTSSDGTNYRADAQIRPPGGSFGAAVQVSPRGANAQSPGVTFDAKGDAIMVWEREGIIQASIRPAGGSFGPAEDVSRGSEAASFPTVTFDSAGDAIVLWVGRTGVLPTLTYAIQSNVRPPGGSFGAPTQLASAKQASIEQMLSFSGLRLAADEQGHVFAVWSLSSTESGGVEQASYSIESSVKSAAGAFGVPTTLAHTFGFEMIEPATILSSPTVAADPQGDAIVAWASRGTASGSVEAKLWSDGAFEANPEKVSGNTEYANSPTLGFTGKGNVVAAWQGSKSGGSAGIFAAERRAGGEFEAPQLLSESGVTSTYPTLAVTAKESVIVAWTREDATSRIETATRLQGQEFGEPVAVSPNAKQFTTLWPSLAVDGKGDGIAGWNRFNEHYVVEAAGYDDAGPSLEDLAIPATGTVGAPLSFTASPLDVWSALDPTVWSFGDGASASGAGVTHAYGAAGDYKVTVTGSDALGNTTTATGTIAIAPQPPGPGLGSGKQAGLVPANTGLSIEGLTQSNRTWREGTTAARFSHSHKPPVGTLFSFGLGRQASVKFTFTQRLSGHMVKGKCVAHASNNRRGGGRRCMRTVTQGSLTFAGQQGPNTLAFQGRMARAKKLPLGSYRLIVTATNAGQRAAAKSLLFTIVN